MKTCKHLSYLLLLWIWLAFYKVSFPLTFPGVFIPTSNGKRKRVGQREPAQKGLSEKGPSSANSEFPCFSGLSTPSLKHTLVHWIAIFKIKLWRDVIFLIRNRKRQRYLKSCILLLCNAQTDTTCMCPATRKMQSWVEWEIQHLDLLSFPSDCSLLELTMQ